MIPTNNAALYADALDALKTYSVTIPNHKGRFVQMFLAMKFYGSTMPSLSSPSGIPVGLFQTMLDALYAKVSQPPTATVLSLFAGTYMPRTGIVVAGSKHGANNWRNNFNLQKGVPCFAPAADLSNPAFLAASRVACPHLLPAKPGVLAGAQCSLNLGPKYRSEDHLKWVQIRPGQPQEYAAVDLANAANFVPYVAPNGNRIPALAAAVAIYYDADAALVTGSRSSIDMNDFQTDFNMTAAEFSTYFDDDPARALNASLLAAHTTVSYNRVGTSVATPAIVALAVPPIPTPRRPRTPAPALPANLTAGTVVAPPATNSGFGAQEYVKQALSATFNVFDVSNRGLGFDLYAVAGRRTRYVEVKSSLGSCTPTLTANEYAAALKYGPDYVLAIIENFNPNSPNTVHFILDPASKCTATASQTIQYSIGRPSWKAAVVPISSL